MNRFLLPALLLSLFTATAGIGSAPARTGDPRHWLDLLPADIPCVPHTIIVKFRSAVGPRLSKSSLALPTLNPTMMKYGVGTVQQMYPGRSRAVAPGGGDIGIERMYRLTYTVDVDPLTVAREFASHEDVEYAEPELVHHVTYVPNDPLLAQQYAVDRIQAKEAWDLTKGDRTVVIAIVDTGVMWTHEDLKDNIHINPGEDVNHDGKYTIADINGSDDDGNGFIDDIVGVDFVGNVETNGGSYYDNDPLPTATGNPHGTHVAGIAAAAGNNAKGISGVAFECRIMPVKCGADNGGRSVLRGYDGIVYAAENGARIINCSWGGGGFVQNEIDRIDYAISKGALVVAAAGNDGRELLTTPGAYPNVLCVANTDGNDRVNYTSTYGGWVDVSAPGTSILSTVSTSAVSYESAGWTGTSMASPCAAGVAALVAAHFPTFTPMQIAEKVRVTAENVDDLQQERYRHKIGFGRVNALRALTFSSPAIKLVDWSFRDDRTGNGNAIIDRGETIEVIMKWKNHLDAAGDADFTLSSTNPNVTVVQGSWHPGALASGQETDNSTTPFVIRIRDAEAPNDRIDLNYAVVDGSYQDFGGVLTYQQPTYRDHDANNVTLTLSNDGNIGFDDFQGSRGRGFLYKGGEHNVLFEGALIIGARFEGGTPIVVDVARDESGNMQTSDFLGTTQFMMKTPGATAAQEGFTTFNDNLALNQLGVTVALHSYEFTTAGREDFVILRYTITNTGGDNLTDLHAGLFFDWDIGNNSQSDRAYWDADAQTFYAYDTKSEVKVVTGGTVLTREKPVHYFGINNPDTDTDLFGIYDGYTKDEKWRSISSGIKQPLSKITDISTVMGSGPYELAVGDSVVIAFAIFGSSNASDLLKSVPHALEAWAQMNSSTGVDAAPAPGAVAITSLWPNPMAAGIPGALTIGYTAGGAGMVRFELTDILGRVVEGFTGEGWAAGGEAMTRRLGGLRAGTYILRMQAPQGAAVAKLVVR